MDASLLSELVVQIFRVNGTLTAWGDRFAAESGLTTARWQVLRCNLDGERTEYFSSNRRTYGNNPAGCAKAVKSSSG